MVIRRARAEVAERRSKLKIEGPDKADVAGAFRRLEIRTRLRDMPAAEQAEYFARLGDKVPGDVAAAVLELPPEYSGVSQARHDTLAKRALDAQNGPELSDIAELETGIDVAESVVEIARDEVRIEVGLDLQQFNKLAAAVEQRHWLRRRGTEVHVVDLERRVAYNSAGQLVSASFSDGSVFTYTYNSFWRHRRA